MSSKGEIMKRTLIASMAFASLLAATSAFAADLPLKAPAPVAAVYDWTGFYIGTNLGYSWGRGSTNGTVTGTQTCYQQSGTHHGDAGLADCCLVARTSTGSSVADSWATTGRPEAGCIGLEGDIQFSNERGSGDVVCSLGAAVMSHVYQGIQAGLVWHRARPLGYLPAERLLLYVTGGLAYGEFSGSSMDSGFNRWTSANGLRSGPAGQLARAWRRLSAATGQSSLNIFTWILATWVVVPRLTSCTASTVAVPLRPQRSHTSSIRNSPTTSCALA